jgi:hypothetical protein
MTTLSTNIYNGVLAISSGGTGTTKLSTALTDLGGQPVLISNSNIQAINGNSVLGSSNIVITDMVATTVTTSNYTASSNDIIKCNSSASSFNIILPLSPTSGDRISIVDATGYFDTKPVTVLPNGNTIESDTSLILNIKNASVTLIYNSNNWKLLQLPSTIFIGPPLPPTLGTATSSATSITVPITAPVYQGTITGYTATSSPGGLTGTAAPGASSISINGITPGTSYTITVVTNSLLGNSAPSTPSNSVVPSYVQKTGTSSYDLTAVGAVTSISALETYSSELPSTGYVKYTLVRSGDAGSNITITTLFKKSGTQLCQSAFSLGSGLSVGTVSSILYLSNDDHDSLVMQGDGTGVISINNTDVWSNYGVGRFRGTTEITGMSGGTVDSCFMYSPNSFINSSYTHLISFPKTNSNLWINFSSGRYKLNSFAAADFPAGFSLVNIGGTTPRNNIMSLSDGVNCFMIYKWSNANATYAEINLSTGEMFNVSTYAFSASQFNGTEEDAQGSQLFAVDGSFSYAANGSFYWGFSAGWRWQSSITSPPYSTGIGASTQHDMDLFGSIDASDNRVWFADWGHDDGGIFQVGNDSQLGVAKTNIYLISNTYTN